MIYCRREKGFLCCNYLYKYGVGMFKSNILDVFWDNQKEKVLGYFILDGIGNYVYIVFV